MWDDILPQIIGAALQKRAYDQAADRQQAEIARMRQRQMMAREQATGEVMRRVQDFAPAARQQQQQEIGQQMSGELLQQATPQITTQGVQVGATLPEGAGSTEYLAAQAREKQKTMASMRQLAQLMGRIGSAGEQRKNEAVNMGDTAGAVGRIQSGAGMQAGLDQLAVQNADRVSPGMLIAGEALRGYGAGRMANSGLRPQRPAFPEYGTASGPTGGWV